MLAVTEKEDLMITCKSGVTIRMKVAQISEQGRATQGVKLIRLDDGDEIAAITRLEVDEENGNGNHEELPEGGATNSPENSSEESTDNQ
jgi:DNA gyrase subunit A